MKNFHQRYPAIKRGIAGKFIVGILIFSSLITLSATSLQLYLDYSYDINSIEESLDQIETSHLEGIIHNIWVSNQRQLQTQLEGILRLPDMQYIEIRENKDLLIASGAKDGDNTLSRDFPLFYMYRGQRVSLGILHVVASLDGVYSRLWDKALVILASQAVKTFLVSTFIFILFYLLIGRHLLTLARYAEHFHPDAPSEPFALERRKSDPPDELDQVVTSMNLMRSSLNRHLSDLKESEARFRDISKSMADWIWEVDAEGHYTYTSGKVKSILGYSVEEMLGKTPFYFMPADEARRVAAVFADIAANQQVIRDLENWNLTKDGRRVCLLTNGIPLLGSKGELLGYRGVDRDITKRKRVEEVLKESEKWFRTTLASVGDAVITTDVAGNVSFLNPTARSLTGFDFKQAKGRPLSDVFNIVNERTRDAVENSVEKVLRENKIVELPNYSVLISKEGIEYPIADSGAPIVDDQGNVLGVVLVFRDMTEQRNLEVSMRQQQKLESIGTLASGVAHEINNPINIIMNYSEILLENAEGGSELEEISGQIISESGRIADIVRNLLHFARQEKESHSPARIKDIVDSTLSIISKVIKKDQILIQVDVAEDLPKIKCRSQQIMQVLMNLLTNARDALNERYPEFDENKIMSVSSRLLGRGSRIWIRTTVEDKGAGISPKVAERIMDPFFTTKGRDKGTGLGLSVSHGIVKDHHGELNFESEKGRFTRFHMDLPVDNGWSTNNGND